MFTNRVYAIFNVSEIPLIDFTQVHETSVETLRLSVDGTQTFVKWDGDPPPCVLALTTCTGFLTHEEMIEEMSTPAWTFPIPHEA